MSCLEWLYTPEELLSSLSVDGLISSATCGLTVFLNGCLAMLIFGIRRRNVHVVRVVLFLLLLLFVRSQYSSLGCSPEKFSYSQSECCPEKMDALCRGLQQSCDMCTFRSDTSVFSVAFFITGLPSLSIPALLA